MTRATQATLALALLACAGCPTEQNGAAAPDPSPGAGAQGTLTWGSGADAVTLDPADATDGESVKAIANLFDTLVRYKVGSTEVEPCLATAWTVSDDRLTWTFTLREGVKFHDGTPCDAAAVAFSFERQRDPQHPFHQGEFVYWHDQFSMVHKVEATDARTVVFRLERPFVPFLANLAMFTASIVSPAQFEALRGKPETFAVRPVGCGPFKLKEWRRGEAVVLEAFDDYWGGRPALDRVVLRTIPDNTSRLKLLHKGELDAIDGLNPADVVELMSAPGVKVVREPGMNTAYLALNNSKPPFDDPKVREAVALALDLEQVAGKLYEGLAIPAANLLPPMIPGWNAEVRPRGQDRARAKALLAEAGHPDGLEARLWTMTNPRPYMPQPDKLAQYVKGALQQVGIKVTIVPKEWASYLQEIQNGEHELCFMGWIGDNGDADNFLYVLLDKDNTTPGSASNYAFYKSEEVHQLLLAARAEFDLAKRAGLYQQAQALIHRDVPLVPLVHNENKVALRERVQGFQLHPTGLLRFHGVKVE
jgi:peptide/nickel transport system substrate-binding protein